MDKIDCSLDKVAIGSNFATDKSKYGHNYNKVYSKYFDEFRDDPIKILEIGVAAGQSAQMWAKYFSNGTVVSIDHDISNYEYPPNDRIVILQVDQRDKDALENINQQYGPFDIIIDDGSHIDEYTKISFDILFPLLKSGGLYIVEDLHTSYHDVVHRIANKPVFINYCKELVDYVNARGYCMSGNLIKCSENVDYQYCEHRKITEMDKLIEFIHFYKSLVFIKKY